MNDKWLVLCGDDTLRLWPHDGGGQEYPAMLREQGYEVICSLSRLKSVLGESA